AALHNLGGRPAAVVSFLDGISPRRVQARHCAALGKALAQLHLAGISFPMARRTALAVSGWRPLFDACRPHADRVLAGLEAEIKRELAAIEREWPEGLPRAVIHAGLVPANVF